MKRKEVSKKSKIDFLMELKVVEKRKLKLFNKIKCTESTHSDDIKLVVQTISIIDEIINDVHIQSSRKLLI